MSKDPRHFVPGLPGASSVRTFMFAGLAMLALASSTPAAVNWTPAGDQFVNAALDQNTLRAVSDGRSGFIAAWIDPRNAVSEIYCQRVDSTGTAQWTANGVLVCSTTATIFGLSVAPDGQGGILLAWTVDVSATVKRSYVQRLNGSGAVQWTPNGLRVDPTVANTLQTFPSVTSDANGGAVVAWVDGRAATDDIYVQRVLSDSTRAWTAGGVPVATDPTDQQTPRAVSDGSGGAFASWEDFGPPVKTHFQHFDPTGAALYAASFVPTTASSPNAFMARQAGSDTLMMVWSSSSPARVCGGKLDPLGNQVPGGGIGLVSTSSLPVGLVSQANGGAIVAYASASQIEALGMNALGAAGTSAVTVAASQTLGAGSNISLVGDGSSGAFCVWSSNNKVFARHVTAAATNDWAAPVALVTGVTSGQTGPAAVGGTDLLAAWVDDRGSATTGDDLFAQRVSFTGVTGSYYRILTSVGTGTGTLTPPAGRTWVRAGDTLLVRCVGTGGQHVDRLVIGATNLDAVPNYTFHSVAGDSTLTAHFTSAAIVTTVAAVANSYRAFSVPSTFSNNATSAVFANLMPYDIKRWRLGHWEADDSTYLEPSGLLMQLVPGAGYWFIGLKDTSLSFTGTALPQSQFTLPMLGRAGTTGPGWTQFGSPFSFPLAVSQLRLSLGPNQPISTPANALTDHQVYEWDPLTSTYLVADVLLPGHAYWLWRQSASAIDLRFPFEWNPVATGGLSPGLVTGADWAIGVTARAGGRAARLTLGAAPVAAGAWNGLSSRALPSLADDGLSLVARIADWGADDGEYQSVFLPDATTLAWDLDARAQGGLTEATLTFAFTNLPPGRKVVLSEPSAGWSRELSADGTASLVLTRSPRRLRLEVLTGAPDPNTLAVTALRAVAPNPFRDATTLSFGLAHAGPLRWDVFDLAGRRIVSQVRALSAGEHALTWDGRDAAGRRVGPGMYLVRWQAGGGSGSARVVRVE